MRPEIFYASDVSNHYVLFVHLIFDWHHASASDARVWHILMWLALSFCLRVLTMMYTQDNLHLDNLHNNRIPATRRDRSERMEVT